MKCLQTYAGAHAHCHVLHEACLAPRHSSSSKLPKLHVALSILSSLRCLHLVCVATLTAAVESLEDRPTCCVLCPDRPKASPKVACLPRADSGAIGGREPALPCPADAGQEDDGPGTPMSSSSSMAAVPLGCGKEASEGLLGRMRAADAVVACADCNMWDRSDGELEEDSKSTRVTGAQHTDLQVVGRVFYILPVSSWSSLHQ